MVIGFVAERLAGVQDVGYPADLEATLGLRPDLILAVGRGAAGESIDAARAGEIAPVVLADPRVYDDWQLGAEFWTAVLGAEALYERMLTNYEARVKELRVVDRCNYPAIVLDHIPCFLAKVIFDTCNSNLI